MPAPAATRAVPAGALVFAWCGAALFAASLIFFLYSYAVRFGAATVRQTPLAAAVLNTALFSAFALHHSLFARTSMRQRVLRWTGPALERSAYVWVASLAFLGVCALWQPLPGELYHLTGVWAVAGLTVQGLGILLTALGSARLDVLDLAGLRGVRPRRRGALVPLQTGGLYRLVRHPVYFAWLLLVFGAPHMTMTRLIFAVVSTAYIALAIPFEERGLVAAFGDEYRQYQRRVRWRLIPGVY